MSLKSIAKSFAARCSDAQLEVGADENTYKDVEKYVEDPAEFESQKATNKAYIEACKEEKARRRQK